MINSTIAAFAANSSENYTGWTTGDGFYAGKPVKLVLLDCPDEGGIVCQTILYLDESGRILAEARAA